MYAVIFDTSYLTKTLFTGTLQDCKQFVRANRHLYGDDVFVGELEECLA